MHGHLVMQPAQLAHRACVAPEKFHSENKGECRRTRIHKDATSQLAVATAGHKAHTVCIRCVMCATVAMLARRPTTSSSLQRQAFGEVST
jgi:hypothetical protein